MLVPETKKNNLDTKEGIVATSMNELNHAKCSTPGRRDPITFITPLSPTSFSYTTAVNNLFFNN